MRKASVVLLLGIVGVAQIPLWSYVGWLAYRTDFLNEVTSEPLVALAAAFFAAMVCSVLSRVAWNASWERRRAASAFFGLSVLNMACLFCFTFFGYVWEYRAGKPFGLLELIKSWF
ncbi:MAG: hypothetical protein GY906_09855 [bacterium]|nr:hypothetical protein [bacterium]